MRPPPTDEPIDDSLRKRPLHRLVTAAIGLLLMGIAAYASFVAGLDGWGAVAVAAVLGLLGVQAIVAAWRGRVAWLARIGPLP